MRIEVNGELREAKNGTSLQSIVSSFVNDTRGIAVAVNNTVVPKRKWEEILLKENDKILLITATQGG